MEINMSELVKRTDFICTLPKQMQNAIKETLIRNGITGEDLEMAINSRCCDIVDALR